AERDEGVVIDIDELRTQAHRAGGAGGEDEVQGMAPGERPTLHRADRCFRPVESLEALGHLARIPSPPPAPCCSSNLCDAGRVMHNVTPLSNRLKTGRDGGG